MEIFIQEADNPEEALTGFFNMLHAQGGSCKLIGQKLAKTCNVPYLEEKEAREEDGKRKNYPTSANDVDGALRRLSELIAVYYHCPSMNLILVDASGEQIGIRSNDLSLFGRIRREQVEKLFRGIAPLE